MPTPSLKIRFLKNLFRLTALVTGALLIASLFISATAQSQQSSYITITTVPFLSFSDIPDSVHYGSYTTDTSGQAFYTQSGSTLDDASVLMVKDTRACGGFEVQLSTSEPAFPATRVVTSTEIDPAVGITGSINNNLIYVTGFSGDTSATAPHNTTCTDFSATATYDSGSCTNTTNNIVGSTRTLMSGALTAPTGRDGEIAVGAAFQTSLDPYTPSGNYSTTLTYTLLDSTTGSCP
jgi:hypothetical protein